MYQMARMRENITIMMLHLQASFLNWVYEKKRKMLPCDHTFKYFNNWKNSLRNDIIYT